MTVYQIDNRAHQGSCALSEATAVVSAHVSCGPMCWQHVHASPSLMSIHEGNNLFNSARQRTVLKNCGTALGCFLRRSALVRLPTFPCTAY